MIVIMMMMMGRMCVLSDCDVIVRCPSALMMFD